MPKRSRITDQKILEVILENPFWTDSQIGEQLGLTRVQVCRRRGSAEFNELYEQVVAKLFSSKKNLQYKALRNVIQKIEDKNSKTSLKASEILLHIMPLDIESIADNGMTTFDEDIMSIIERNPKLAIVSPA